MIKFGPQIEDAFKNMGGGIKESAIAKVAEYDERLRAAQAGRPLRTGDTVENLLPDFKRMTKRDWTADFDMKQYRDEQLGDVPGEQTGVVEKPELADAERVSVFILKLAEGQDISDQEAVEAIVKQIKLLEADQNFPELVAALDPESYHPQTKQLDDKAKERLEAALNQYTHERG